ncbi:MAG: DNA polymerase III subunit chi [Beijerinckiaceae bacterium]
MEVMFYQLLHAPLERALPQLLEKTLERNWKAVVRAASDERVAALDDLLWTWRDDSFLPHASSRDGDSAQQPIWLTACDENPNGAQVRFFVDGVDIVEPLTSAPDSCERAVLMFDGRDDEQLARARAQWKQLKDAGYALQYWAQRENGSWEKKA